MDRNSFQTLLRFFHISNNDYNPGDRLGKTQPLVDFYLIIHLYNAKSQQKM